MGFSKLNTWYTEFKITTFLFSENRTYIYSVTTG